MTDHLIPSVEDAAMALLGEQMMFEIWASFCGCGFRCNVCQIQAGNVENRALALDMANAAASDRRRAADDELRRSVAW